MKIGEASMQTGVVRNVSRIVTQKSHKVVRALVNYTSRVEKNGLDVIIAEIEGDLARAGARLWEVKLKKGDALYII